MAAKGDDNGVAAQALCVGVCTRRRPAELARLLASLESLTLPPAVGVTLCVVENDATPRCEQAVAHFATVAPIRVRYTLEPRAGLPQARNRLLAEATALGAAALVFVDDDEEVDPGWLLAMVDFAAQNDWRVIVQGRVATRLPPGAPGYLLRFFQRGKRATGERLRTCASNNTLLPLAPVAEAGLAFDESRPFDGGEDTVFFARCREAGIPLLYCLEALVTETILPGRANLRWLSARKFRVGLLMGSGLVAGKPRSAAKSLFYLLKSPFQCLAAALLLLCLRREGAIAAWLGATRSAGYALGFLRLRTEAYRHPGGGG